MPDLRMTVNGTDYEGWKTVRIQRSVDTISGAFVLDVSDKWSAGILPIEIKAGDECELSIAGEVIITGYVDKVSPRFDDRSRSISIAGRDKTADMVDCSAMNEPGSWDNITIGDLATKLADPFGIKVTDESGDSEKFKLAKLQPGETAYEMLERYTRQRGILVLSDGKGGIVLKKIGGDRADVSLQQGVNIKAAEGVSDYSARYNEYIVTGQSFGDDLLFGDEAAQIDAKAKDAEIRTLRRLKIIAANATDAQNMKKVAEWEATIRAARGTGITVTVQGWEQLPGGRLWTAGDLVEIQSDWLQIGQPKDMLINSVEFSKDDQNGTITVLQLVRPDAYEPKPEVPEQEDLWGLS